MSAREAVKPLQEYVNVPLAELVESSTNPRKTFDEERLEELVESIRSKGILSPLLARRVNGHFEIVSGARRYRAAQRAGLQEVPVRIAVLTDAETLEAQIVENLISEVTCIPSRKRRGFAPCSNAMGPDTPLRSWQPRPAKMQDTFPSGSGSWT